MGLNAMSMVPQPQRASRAIGRLGSTPPVSNVLHGAATRDTTHTYMMAPTSQGEAEHPGNKPPRMSRKRLRLERTNTAALAFPQLSSATDGADKKTREHKVLTLDEIRPFFYVSLLEASTSLGVCTTNLKKQSRRLVRT